MARTITVKGVGKATARPDWVVLALTLEAHDMDYEGAMDRSARQIQNLYETVRRAGFEKGDLKTTDFDVSVRYKHEKDRNGNYQSVFDGYAVTDRLKLSFDFSMERLSEALSAIADCMARPEFSIQFTVKDAVAINEEMLRSATANARRKAEILCEASGVTLGELLAIDYNWGELDIYSHTQFDVCEDAMPKMTCAPIDIEPDDISVSDTATFVWEIR